MTPRKGPVPPETIEKIADAIEKGEEAEHQEELAEAPDNPEREAEQADPHTCPLCGGVGRLDVPPKQHDRYQTCPGCDGWGQVSTGSHTLEAAIIQCPDCDGRGYRDTSLDAPIDLGQGQPTGAGSEDLGYTPWHP